MSSNFDDDGSENPGRPKNPDDLSVSSGFGTGSDAVFATGGFEAVFAVSAAEIMPIKPIPELAGFE